MESYDKIKKTLAVAFMHDLDNNRPEGKMCLSNGECADIEKAFGEQDWSKLARYLDKYTESEDERIRAVILKLVLGMRNEIFTTADKLVTKPKVLDWLEKQKEQKPTDLPAGFYYIDLNGNRYYSKEFRYGDMKLKVVEQKPVEKQDYSGLNDFERAIHRGFLCAGVENVPVTIIKETAKDCLAHLPAEWSEEDDQLIGFIFDLLNDLFWRNDWAMSKEECLERLNSLRPSWKPSEEQIQAIIYLASSIPPNFLKEQEYTMRLVDEVISNLKKLCQ